LCMRSECIHAVSIRVSFALVKLRVTPSRARTRWNPTTALNLTHYPPRGWEIRAWHSKHQAGHADVASVGEVLSDQAIAPSGAGSPPTSPNHNPALPSR